MLSDTSKLEKTGRYGGYRIYIPSSVIKDSQFPLKVNEDVFIEIDVERKALIIVNAGKSKELYDHK
ncbi:hypothetical protein FJY84_08915 [Candidatus Bathyarchaeota archaeon]|nr:hypothetical protein [Candidatus Bathyarchaeota archaeon]